MEKIAILIFADSAHVEGLGRVANAFVLGDEAVENGDKLRIIFQGAGTKWIGELEKEDHKLHEPYMKLKKYIEVCPFCARAFGVIQHAEKAGLRFADEYKDHPSVRNMLAEGYHVLVY